MLLLSFTVSPAYAQGNTNNAARDISVSPGRQATITPKANNDGVKLRADQCEQVREKVQIRINHYKQNRARYQELFQRANAQMEALLSVLDERGYNTTQAREELAVMQQKRLALMEEIDAATTQLEATRDLGCDGTRQQYQEQIKEARRLLQNVQAEVRGLAAHYRNRVRLEIQALKNQTPSVTVSVNPAVSPSAE